MLFGPFHLQCNHWLTIYGKAAWGVLIKNSEWSLLCLLLSRFQRWLWDAGTSGISPRDLDVNMASIALSLAIPDVDSIPRHSSPPSKSGLNSAPPVGSWCTYEMDLSPWQSHNSNISHEISRKDGSDGSADPGWCSLKITPRNQMIENLPARTGPQEQLESDHCARPAS